MERSLGREVQQRDPYSHDLGPNSTVNLWKCITVVELCLGVLGPEIRANEITNDMVAIQSQNLKNSTNIR